MYISLLYRRGWSTCPSGLFLRGLYRSGDNKLYNLEYAKCCKPAYHPYWHGSCYNKDVGVSFDKKGWNLCAANYFMTGFYRSDGQKLYNIEKFKCCKMVSGESIYIYQTKLQLNWGKLKLKENANRRRNKRRFKSLVCLTVVVHKIRTLLKHLIKEARQTRWKSLLWATASLQLFATWGNVGQSNEFLLKYGLNIGRH